MLPGSCAKPLVFVCSSVVFKGVRNTVSSLFLPMFCWMEIILLCLPKAEYPQYFVFVETLLLLPWGCIFVPHRPAQPSKWSLFGSTTDKVLILPFYCVSWPHFILIVLWGSILMKSSFLSHCAPMLHCTSSQCSNSTKGILYYLVTSLKALRIFFSRKAHFNYQ